MDLLILITLLPSYVLGKYIYKKDKVEKEPLMLLLILFLSGVVAVLMSIAMSYLTKSNFPILNSKSMDFKTIFIQNFLGIALVEEFFKWFFLNIIAWRNKNFNFLFDGIVYGVFVALGFATLENILYVFNVSTEFSTAILRALLSVPGHCFFGVFMGYYFGLARMAKNNNRDWFIFYVMSLLIPIILHGIFDFCLSWDKMIYIFVFAGFVSILYLVSFLRIRRLSQNDKYIK